MRFVAFSFNCIFFDKKMGNYEVKSVFHLGHYFLLAISPIAYSDNTIIPDRVYDPYRNSAVTPDGTVYDRLTGGVLKASEHPQPNFGFPVQSSSDSCDTTYVKS